MAVHVWLCSCKAFVCICDHAATAVTSLTASKLCTTHHILDSCIIALPGGYSGHTASLTIQRLHAGFLVSFQPFLLAILQRSLFIAGCRYHQSNTAQHLQSQTFQPAVHACLQTAQGTLYGITPMVFAGQHRSRSTHDASLANLSLGEHQ